MRLFLLVFVAWVIVVVLTGCGTQPKPQLIKVPVATSCVPASVDQTPKLETKETLAQSKDDADFLKRLYADWLERVARMAITEPVVANCR